MLLGGGETATLVSKDGSIHWLCWPPFISDACFAALLGRRTTSLLDRSCRRCRSDHPGLWRRYADLETPIETDEGSPVVTEFKPVRGSLNSDLTRIVIGERGTVRDRAEDRMRWTGGRLTCRERARLDRRQDRASARIFRQKHDRQDRW
nr:trehalase-like domain-containing protein [Sphingosinicella sp. CPCC 101087]